MLDLTDKTFGRLRATARAQDAQTSKGKRTPMWYCECECGNTVTVRQSSLTSGHTKSCGCLYMETRKVQKNVTHGQSRSRLYRIWNGMIQRCINPNDDSYERYGGRGIVVCEDWLNSFESFYAWAMASGYEDDLSIDRMDFNLDYAPTNCKWSTPKEQANNKSDNINITIGGVTKTLREWCPEYGISYATAWKRIRRMGWSPEEAVTTPLLKSGTR